MTIQDMDICLNITTGTASDKPKKTKREWNVKTKRLEKAGAQNETNKAKSVVGTKARIKQKSLGTIIANNMKRANAKNTPTKSILKKPSSKLNDKTPNDTNTLNEKKVVKTVVFSKAQNVSPEKKPGDVNKSLISFEKIPENTPKVILAKKRKDMETSKKSLTDIFSTRNSQTEDHKVQQNVDTIKQNKSDQEADSEKGVNIKDVNSTKNIKSKQKQEKNKNKLGRKKNNNRAGNFPMRQSGQISSLFGNNPEIPNIGQRHVKPVNEAVFTSMKFSDLEIHEYSISNLEKNMKITTPTTVQMKAIPHILSGKDVLIRSQTGSGKTLAYALPIVESLQKIRPMITRESGIMALIIVPTRELALQTYECFLKLVKSFTRIVPGYLVGGEKRKSEKARLRRGCSILIATPGRLLDHARHTAALKLHGIKCFVLDEADRMLDMGYEKDISEIVSFIKKSPEVDNSGYNPMEIFKQNTKKKFTDEELERVDEISDENNEVSDTENEALSSENTDDKVKSEDVEIDKTKDRQTILLSATLTQAVEKLAGLTMENPTFVDAAKENLESAGGSSTGINEDLIVPQSVTQSYIITPPKLRMVTLSAYIAGKCQKAEQHKILVFMATQDMVDYHTEVLSSILSKPVDEEDEDSDPLVDVEFFKLHGNMTQKERTDVFKSFRKVRSGVLLCTDVAARGLDMPKVNCVIQYTGPTSARDYVHRIGRTARAGTSGSAIIFLTPPEIDFVRMLESRRIRIEQTNMNKVLDNLVGPFSKHYSVQSTATNLQNDFENLVLESKKLYGMACKAFVSWVRFYSTYPREMRELFNRKDLHLGHYAKSFALRDPPQKIGGVGKTIRQKEEDSKSKHNNRLTVVRDDGAPKRKQSGDHDKRTGMLKKVKMLTVSEFE